MKLNQQTKQQRERRQAPEDILASWIQPYLKEVYSYTFASNNKINPFLLLLLLLFFLNEQDFLTGNTQY